MLDDNKLTKLLISLDTASYQNVGLSYWVNSALREISPYEVISLLAGYIAMVTEKTADFETQSRDEVYSILIEGVTNILEEHRQYSGSRPDTDTDTGLN